MPPVRTMLDPCTVCEVCAGWPAAVWVVEDVVCGSQSEHASLVNGGCRLDSAVRSARLKGWIDGLSVGVNQSHGGHHDRSWHCGQSAEILADPCLVLVVWALVSTGP